MKLQTVIILIIKLKDYGTIMIYQPQSGMNKSDSFITVKKRI